MKQGEHDRSLEKHLNIRRVFVAIAIFVFAFLIVFGSALIVSNSKGEKDKDVNSGKVAVKNETSEEKTENVVENEENTANETLATADESEDNKNTANTVSKPSSTANKSGKKIPVVNPNAVELCKETQSSKEKNIYLTFDDGPSPNITPQILKILKQYNVPATFFVLGSRVELYPDLVKQEYDEGHFIANHGYSHKYSSIYSSVQAVIDEYNATDQAIQNALGIPEYRALLFRFPGGSSGGPYHDLKQSAKSTLESMGIASTNWNCLTGDSEGNGKSSKEQLVNRLYETAQGWTSLVVLMHDANDKQTTADALPTIIEHYKNEGYTFKNYYEIFQ